MRVSRRVTVLGCLVVAGCAAGPTGSSTAGSTAGSTPAVTAAAATPAAVTTTTTPTVTSTPPTSRPTCAGSGGAAPDGARLRTAVAVTGAWVCRGGTPALATPAEARALAAALAQPTPARRKVVCANNIRFDAPTWYLTTAAGQVIRPAAPTDSCGQPIQAVQLAVAAITAR